MIQTSSFAFIGYPVTDLKRARSFYEGVLGFKPAATWGNEETGWIEYELNGVALAITNEAPEKWKPCRDGPAVAIEVVDFEEALAHLKAAGVPLILGPGDSESCKIGVIADPDGNSIAIHYKKS